jgi:hypothetical protein
MNIYAIVIENGIADLYDYLWPKLEYYSYFNPSSQKTVRWNKTNIDKLRTEVESSFNHKDKLSKFKGKSLITCSLHDTNIKIDNSELIFSWLSEPKQIMRFSAGNHNTIFTYNYIKYCDLLFNLIHI